MYRVNDRLWRGRGVCARSFNDAEEELFSVRAEELESGEEDVGGDDDGSREGVDRFGELDKDDDAVDEAEDEEEVEAAESFLRSVQNSSEMCESESSSASSEYPEYVEEEEDEEEEKNPDGASEDKSVVHQLSAVSDFSSVSRSDLRFGFRFKSNENTSHDPGFKCKYSNDAPIEINICSTTRGSADRDILNSRNVAKLMGDGDCEGAKSQ